MKNPNNQNSHLFVISGPSGSGKSTIIKSVMHRVENLWYSVSHTTRKPRPGERHGVDYFFVDKKRFKEMIDKGEFIEWAKVYSDFYGTSFSSIKDRLNEGKDVILDLDVQGSMNIRGHFNNLSLIFILPPSLEELEKRLRIRGTDETIIRIRMSKVKDEIEMSKKYDFIVINHILDKAVKEVESIIVAERCRALKRLSYVNSLI